MDGRSDFLRGQLVDWLEQVAESGRTAELFELEMWLQSFERFFRIKNQPISDRDAEKLSVRDWSDELRLVNDGLRRVAHLCTAILTEDQLNQARFDRYVETWIKKDETLDPYVEKMIRLSTPEAGLTLLRESFEDLHLVINDLNRLARISFPTFQSIGRLIYREIRRSHLLAFLIDKKFKPVHDRIRNPAVSALVRRIPDPTNRRHAARVFLELFRLLRYLDYTDPARVPEDQLRDTILIFSLIVSEARLLLAYIERRVLTGLALEDPVYGVYDSFVYCLPFELRKVISTELAEVASSRRPEAVRARIENSHGILRDSFQQSIVQLAQAFDPETDGDALFADFTARREQSLRLRDALLRLIGAVQDFARKKDEAAAQQFRDETSYFYDNSIRYLMFRDWSGFELFYIEILKCTSLPGLQAIAHRFETFLQTLFREVQKRSAFQPQEEGIAEQEGAPAS
jgi:hypothetical protein